jgi:hypothetical protein
LESTGDDGGCEEISEGEALAHKESLVLEMVLQDTDNPERGCLSSVNALLVVRVATNQRTEPRAKVGKDLGVCKGHPPEDRGIVLFGLPQERGLLILGSDWLMSAKS